MKNTKIYAITLALISSISASAQQYSPMTEFSYFTSLNPHLEYTNASLIKLAPVKKIATAGAYFEKANGNLISLNESPDCFTAGINTEAYIKANSKLTLYGKIGYSYFQGKNMSAQILIDPDYNPVNFLEMESSNKGLKVKELYDIKAGLAYNLASRWSIGARINYQAGDMAKRKDPRFRNIWMDLDASAGISYSVSKKNTFGLSAIVRNTVEQIKGQVFGTTDKQYMIFTDKGNFFGSCEQLDGDFNYLPTSEARPMSNLFYGAALQDVHKDAKMQISNEAAFLRRTGYYGQKSSAKATFFEFEGYKFQYKGSFAFNHRSFKHIVNINAGYETVLNRENILMYVTHEGQNTTVEYLGQRDIMHDKKCSLGASYSFLTDVQNAMPRWTVKVSGGVCDYHKESSLYPLSTDYKRRVWNGGLSAGRNIMWSKNLLSLKLEGIYSYGRLDFTSNIDESTNTIESLGIYCSEEYFSKDAIMWDKSKITASAQVRYLRQISGRLSVYVSLSDRYITRGGNIWRNVALLSVGCNF